ncbi:hypothetical protein [Microbacterium maritypicum]
MGTLRYPGAPDFTYEDQTISNLMQIIRIQQEMGQGFWLVRRGADLNLMGHDAIWINPQTTIYAEFDALDAPLPQKATVDEWLMALTVHGAERIVISPPEAVLRVVRDEWEREE